VVRFQDGAEQAYAANLIAENLYSQVDQEGHHFTLMKEIIDHEVSESAALPRDQSQVRDQSGRLRPKRTTKGWKMLVEWKDGTTTWTFLKDLKESNPVEVAEYAVANNIATEPAFAW
jgi:hypothetical protein